MRSSTRDVRRLVRGHQLALLVASFIKGDGRRVKDRCNQLIRSQGGIDPDDTQACCGDCVSPGIRGFDLGRDAVMALHGVDGELN